MKARMIVPSTPPPIASAMPSTGKSQVVIKGSQDADDDVAEQAEAGPLHE